MKGFVLEKFGTPPIFGERELPIPELKPGHLLVEVAATSVNPVDYKIADGTLEPLAPPLPRVLQTDMSGVVAAVGEDAPGFKVGDRVFGVTGGVGATQGSLADFQLVDARLVAHVPRNIALEEAAALPLVAITATEAIAHLQPLNGKRVLITGGAGGVGHIAVQLAKNAGAQVFATASGAKADLLRGLGVDFVINREMPIAEIIEQYTDGKGFDAIFDTVGGTVLADSFRLAKLHGTVVTTLALGNFDLSTVHERALSFHVIFMLIPLLHNIGRERHSKILADIAAQVDAGQVKPIIDASRFTFEQTAEAHLFAQSGKQTGKVLIVKRPH